MIFAGELKGLVMSEDNLTRRIQTEGERKIARTIGYYAVFVSLGIVSALLGPTLSGLARHTQTSLSEISILFTARLLGYMLGSLLGGRLYDKVSGHPLMASVLTAMAVMMALTPLMSHLWPLALVILILGMGEGTLVVGANTLLVWVHRHKVGPFINGLHAFFGIGAFVAPIIIARATSLSGDIAWAYWILALMIMPAAIWLIRLPSPGSEAEEQSDSGGNRSYPLVALTMLFLFFAIGVEISYAGWIYTYALRLNLGSEASAAYLTSAFWAAMTLGRLLAIPISARFKPRTMLMGDLAGCLVSTGVMLVWSNTLTVWLGTLGMGLSIASAFTSTLALAERRMTITGQIIGLLYVGLSLGGMFFPWLIGQFFESTGAYMMMLIIIVVLIVAVGVLAIILNYSKRSQTRVMSG